jgi:hypothetical protein
MTVTVIIPAVLLLLGSNHLGAQAAPARVLPKFMGRDVTVVVPETDTDGFFPKGPASVCIEGPPRRQCYTAPKDFGRSPTVEVVQLGENMPALLFSAASGGVSGFGIHFALLQPGTANDLNDLFPYGLSVSNQSEHAFWNHPSISDAPIFVTADYEWGPDESHYSPHRYIISAYVRESARELGGPYYYLDDRFMTVHIYDYTKPDILTSENREILARLKRVKAETARRRATPGPPPKSVRTEQPPK